MKRSLTIHSNPATRLAMVALGVSFCLIASGQPAPVGEIKGSALTHTAASAKAVVEQASVALPSSVTGGTIYFGTLRNAPTSSKARVPVEVFLHGSSGLGLKAIGEWQRWLAELGVASLAPDSFALPNRVTYTSPVNKAFYEQIHELRASEIPLAVAALRTTSWADTTRMLLSGASEGGPAVTRYSGHEFSGRMVYSWSCENNYFVQDHRTADMGQEPVLNVMSLTDVYFSTANSWLGNPAAKGFCAEALTSDKQATIVLIPGAPHTLLNLPAARHATASFVKDVLRP